MGISQIYLIVTLNAIEGFESRNQTIWYFTRYKNTWLCRFNRWVTYLDINSAYILRFSTPWLRLNAFNSGNYQKRCCNSIWKTRHYLFFENNWVSNTVRMKLSKVRKKSEWVAGKMGIVFFLCTFILIYIQMHKNIHCDSTLFVWWLVWKFILKWALNQYSPG